MLRTRLGVFLEVPDRRRGASEELGLVPLGERKDQRDGRGSTQYLESTRSKRAYPCPTTTRRKSDALRPAEAMRGAM